MPQDGSNNYYYPLGTPGVPDQTVESEAFNTFIDDLVINDLNIARSIHRGGTGATTADQALANLKAEKSSQAVTNYDAHEFLDGSFYSAPGATSAPNSSSWFAGVVYGTGFGVVFLEAVDYNTADHPRWTRIKDSLGNWGAWIQRPGYLIDIVAAAEASYVNLTGDTMSGHLTLPAGPAADQAVRKDYVDTADASVINYVDVAHASQTSYIDAADTTLNNAKVNRSGDTMSGTLTVPGLVVSTPSYAQISFDDSGLYRWAIRGADLATDNFEIHRWSGSGTYAGIVASIDRGTGTATFTNSLISGGTLTGGAVPPGGISLSSSGTQKFIAFSSTEYFMLDTADSTLRYRLASVDRFYVPGATGHLHVASNGYKPGGGVWGDSSDARIKTVLGDYSNGLDEILALHPVRYTFKGNDTFGPPEHLPQLDENRNALPRSEEPLTVPYPNSPHHWAATEGIEYVGLVAQEVETISPDMVTQHAGHIDGQPVPDIRDLDTTALIFKLINAVKTLNARIEALESA